MSFTLHEKRILITREESQAKEFSEKVLQYGGKPIELPLLKISCKDKPKNKQLFENLHCYKWIFFTSANGVECFFRLAKQYMWTNDVFVKMKFAAVGHKTAQTLEAYGYHADFIPTTYNAEVMASEFVEQYTVTKEKLLLIRGNRSRDVLPDFFTEHEIHYHVMEVYETMYNFDVKAELNQLLSHDTLDFITFTSPSTVEAYIEMKENKIRNNSVFVCIGTTTEERASELGITNIVTPQLFTIDGMLEQISDYIAWKG